MSNMKLVLVILAAILVQTCSKPLESTDEQLSEMEKDLASLSFLSDNKEQDAKDEDKIPESLLEDLKSSDAKGQQSNPFDKAALQGFAPGTATDEESKKTMETNDFLLSEDDINEKQKRLFEILTRAESEDNSKNAQLNPPGEDEDKDKIPEDLLKDLEAKNREDQPRKPAENTWLEANDKNDVVKKEILTGILMDEIVNEIKERNKRGERIPGKVLDLLKKYNAKRSGPKH